MYSPCSSSSGGDIPSPCLFHGPCHGPAHGGDPSLGSVPGNSPRVGRGCGTCDACFFLWSDCGLAPWNALFWGKGHVQKQELLGTFHTAQKEQTSPGDRAVAFGLYPVETILQRTDEHFTAVVC